MKLKMNPLRTAFLSFASLLILNGALAQETTDEFSPSSNVIKSINAEYHPKVVGISKDGIIQGVNPMRDYLMEFYRLEGARTASEEPFRTVVTEKLEYEIGTFKTEKGTDYATISIWVKENGLEQKILEAVYQMTENTELSAKEEIAGARKKWVTLCNAHNAGKLVAELYTEDAIYYNRGRVLIGREALTAEYSYMNNQAYSLDLNPTHIQLVSKNMAFELGRCSGSYNLPYILIWKKEADGNWRVFFDSNY